MAERFINPTHYPWRIDQYVPKMTLAADLGHNNVYTVDLGAPETLDADGILDGEEADDSGPYTYTPSDFKAAITAIDSDGIFVDAPFGRDITAVGSAAGVTQNLTVVGYDYLGQKITKVKAMNGATPIALGVAFKRIESITIAVGESGETIDVGFSNAFGVPYKTVRVLAETVSGVGAATVGTLALPVLTDPATNATGDPRGLFTPNTTPDGTKRFYLTAMASSWYNSDGNGGLHGIKHFGG